MTIDYLTRQYNPLSSTTSAIGLKSTLSKLRNNGTLNGALIRLIAVLRSVRPFLEPSKVNALSGFEPMITKPFGPIDNPS